MSNLKLLQESRLLRKYLIKWVIGCLFYLSFCTKNTICKLNNCLLTASLHFKLALRAVLWQEIAMINQWPGSNCGSLASGQNATLLPIAPPTYTDLPYFVFVIILYHFKLIFIYHLYKVLLHFQSSIKSPVQQYLAWFWSLKDRTMSEFLILIGN